MPSMEKKSGSHQKKGTRPPLEEKRLKNQDVTRSRCSTKKVFVAMAFAVTTLVALSAPVQAANKEGGKCAKAGASTIVAGKKLVCRKQGKTLKWVATQVGARRYTVSFYAERDLAIEHSLHSAAYHVIIRGGPVTVEVSPTAGAEFGIPFTVEVAIRAQPITPNYLCMVNPPSFSVAEVFSGTVKSSLWIDSRNPPSLRLEVNNFGDISESLNDGVPSSDYGSTCSRDYPAYWRYQAWAQLPGPLFVDSMEKPRATGLNGGIIGETVKGWEGSNYTITPVK